jgi:hypothetical protein
MKLQFRDLFETPRLEVLGWAIFVWIIPTKLFPMPLSTEKIGNLVPDVLLNNTIIRISLCAAHPRNKHFDTLHCHSASITFTPGSLPSRLGIQKLLRSGRGFIDPRLISIAIP